MADLLLYYFLTLPSLGMGPMPWTINSEIYPLWARSTGNACAAGMNWTFNILVSLTFLHLAQYFTYYGQFLDDLIWSKPISYRVSDWLFLWKPEKVI